MSKLTPGRIRHGVLFSLVHKPGGEAEADFLRTVSRLGNIPGVEAFELMREVSPTNSFSCALTMEFADQTKYDAYNAHPDHIDFVAKHWQMEVTEFLETDTQAL